MPSDEHGEDSVKAGDTLLRAVWLVTVADIVMSLDNVIAIAAAAETAAARVDIAHALSIKTTLIVFGLATSVPLIIAGSALLMALLNRFPILVWAGAGLLGWVAGEIMIKDAADRRAGSARPSSTAGTSVGGGAPAWSSCIALGWIIRRIQHKRALEQPLIIDPPGPEEFPRRAAE